MYVIVTNHVNWHKENLLSDRENTGNLKIQFEWVPCSMCALPSYIDGRIFEVAHSILHLGKNVSLVFHTIITCIVIQVPSQNLSVE